LPNKLNSTEKFTGSLVRLMEQLGLITREPVKLAQMKRTFKLTAEQKSSTALVVDVPCFSCSVIDRCAHSPDVNPVSCRKLDAWLVKQRTCYIR